MMQLNMVEQFVAPARVITVLGFAWP